MKTWLAWQSDSITTITTPFAPGRAAQASPEDQPHHQPLGLRCRLAASGPPPKLHTVRYAGVLGSGNRLRSRVSLVRA